MSGFHIENSHFHRAHFERDIAQPNEDLCANCDKLEHKSAPLFSRKDSRVLVTDSVKTEPKNATKSLRIKSEKNQTTYSPTSQTQTSFPVKSSKNKSMHPDAFISFICGILAMTCLIAIIATGLAPLSLFIALIALLLVFSILAGKLAKRAFKDMYYAHDRFRGKALATIGLVVGILSLVALLAIFIIIFLGIAFILLT